jgi:16S rRNA (guanine527-N7)-methyltransferase
MSPKGRPEGEYRSAQREGTSICPKGRPEGEYRSAQREGTSICPKGRPEAARRRAIARRPMVQIWHAERVPEAEA